MFKGHHSTTLTCGICYIDILSFFFSLSTWQVKVHIFKPIGSNSAFDGHGVGNVRRRIERGVNDKFT